MSKSNKQQVPKVRFTEFSGDWEKDILGKTKDVRDGTHDSPKLISEGYPLVTSKNLKENGLDMSDISYISEADYKSINKRSEVTIGDILFAMIGTIGNPIIIKQDNFAIKNVALIKNTGTVSNEFLLPLLKSDVFEKYIYIENAGNTQKFLALGKIREFSFHVPTTNEQTQIGNFFQQLDKLIELQTRAVESAEMYKKAMLQKMFPQKGEKVPRVRFEGFSGDWSEFKIGNITSSYSGGTPSVTESSYYNGDIPFIRSGEIDSKETELFITELGLNNSSAKMVEKGDILYALYGATSGEVSRSKIKGAINQAILAIRPKTQFCSEYLCQLLGFMKDEIVNKYLQGGQGNLSGAIIKDLKITLPDLKEQTQIGNFFQKLDQNIEAEKKKLEQYQTMKRAMLQRMFV